MDRPDPEAGSALIYILIGVVLFAVLAAAIANTNRGGITGPDQDIDRLQVTEIVQYAHAVQTAVQAMIIDGTDPGQLSFENPIAPGYANGACAVDRCKIFSGGGGGIAYDTPLQNKWLDVSHGGATGYGTWVFSGANAFPAVATDDGSDAAADLVMILPYVKKTICLQINTMLGIDNPGGDAPSIHADADFDDKFDGTFHTVETLAGGSPALSAQRAGCFQGAGNPPAHTYHFFQVLVAR